MRTAREDVVARQQSGRLAERVDDREFVLRRRQQRVDRLAEIGVDRDRREARLHRVADAHPLERLLRGAHLRLGGRGDIDEDGDEQEQRIAEQAEKPEAEGEGLADPCRDLGRPRAADPHRQQRMQHSPAVHRKGRDQIEDGEKDVGDRETPDEREVRIVDLRQVVGMRPSRRLRSARGR